MNQENQIVQQVEEARMSAEAADGLVRKYLPFVKSETAKFIHRPPREGQDDELSIALFAFHEAILNYDKKKGAFLSFAAVGIKNRLIDYYRREKRHGEVLSLDSKDEGDDKSLLEQIDSGKDEMEECELRYATKTEIMEFTAQLSEYGLCLAEIADNCPRQERTLAACHQALSFARANPELLETLVSTKKLPISRLASGSGVEKKTLERHRKYMVAIMLAYTNGFEIIRGHLCQIAPMKGGQGK